MFYKMYSSIFLRFRESGIVILVVYVDDILLTDNEINNINEVKSYLHYQFQLKNLGKPKYFFRN